MTKCPEHVKKTFHCKLPMLQYRTSYYRSQRPSCLILVILITAPISRLQYSTLEIVVKCLWLVSTIISVTKGEGGGALIHQWPWCAIALSLILLKPWKKLR